jgi:hypothetical protein
VNGHTAHDVAVKIYLELKKDLEEMEQEPDDLVKKYMRASFATAAENPRAMEILIGSRIDVILLFAKMSDEQQAYVLAYENGNKVLSRQLRYIARS